MLFHVKLKNASTLIQRSRCVSNQSVNVLSGIHKSFIKRKLDQLVQWYEVTTGMDEVRHAQNRVLDAEDKFVNAQERRRDSNKEVALVQKKLKEIYAELDNTARGEDRYVTLVTEEHKLLKQEKQVLESFQNFEKEERECFTVLSSAVKESHEKERAQAERTKYWSIIGSVFGTILGILGSSINNEIRMRELRTLLKESVANHNIDTSTSIPETLSKQEKQLSRVINEMKLLSNSENNSITGTLNSIHCLLGKVEKDENTRSNTLLNALREHNTLLENNFKELKSIIALQGNYQNMRINKQIVELDDSDDQYNESVYLKIGILVIATTFISQILRCYF